MNSLTNVPFTLCVDLDGVCADYEAAFAQVVADRTGVPLSQIGPQTHWDFSQCPNWPIDTVDEFLQLHNAAVHEHDMFATMPEIEGASDMLWQLSDEFDVRIRVVTHRLIHNWGHDRVVADTVRWLQEPRQDGRPRVPYRDICFIADKSSVNGDLYVDDAPHNVEMLRQSGIDAMVMTAGYNAHISGLRADSWVDVYRHVAALQT